MKEKKNLETQGRMSKIVTRFFFGMATVAAVLTSGATTAIAGAIGGQCLDDSSGCTPLFFTQLSCCVNGLGGATYNKCSAEKYLCTNPYNGSSYYEYSGRTSCVDTGVKCSVSASISASASAAPALGGLLSHLF